MERYGRLEYHVYFISSSVQLMDEIAFTYRDSLMAMATTQADWETVKVSDVETHDPDCDHVESEESADVLEMQSYFIFSEIPEQ